MLRHVVLTDVTAKVRAYLVQVGANFNKQCPYWKTRLAKLPRQGTNTIQGIPELSGNHEKLNEAEKIFPKNIQTESSSLGLLDFGYLSFCRECSEWHFIMATVGNLRGYQS